MAVGLKGQHYMDNVRDGLIQDYLIEVKRVYKEKKKEKSQT